MDQPVAPPRAPLADHYLRDEAQALAELMPQARLAPDAAARVHERARALVLRVRAKQQAASGMQSFLSEYDLSSQEGVLLMCVAEALLRIPDAATADKLIRDKLSQGDWERHVGRNPSLLVNAGTWGMMLTGKLVSLDPAGAGSPGAWFARLAARAGEPVVRVALRQGMKLMAEQFVMGRTIGSALERSRDSANARYRHSYDMLGEAAFTAADAGRYETAYAAAIDAIAAHAARHHAGAATFERPGISIKLSALHPRYEYAQRERALAELVPRTLALVTRAREGDVGVTLDAEEADRLELSLDVFERVFASPALEGWEGFGLAVQAYQKRAPDVVDWLAALARSRRRRIMVRLVKGAYWDTEVKRAQVQGLSGYPVYTRKCNTDVSYLACAARILAAPDAFYGQFATHNAHTVATVLERAARGPGVRVPAPARHGRGPLRRGAGGRQRVPRLRAGGKPRGPAAVPGAAVARERRQHVVREPHRRCRDPGGERGRRPGRHRGRQRERGEPEDRAALRDLSGPPQLERHRVGRRGALRSRCWPRCSRCSRAPIGPRRRWWRGASSPARCARRAILRAGGRSDAWPTATGRPRVPRCGRARRPHSRRPRSAPRRSSAPPT